jgi:D-galactose 1-dehydrogenase
MTTPKIKIAIVGLGKIARDQHVPSLLTSDAFELTAVASPDDRLDGTPSFKDFESMLRTMPEIEAVALCTSPQVRYPLARFALQQLRHVLLEKPPGVTLGEVQALEELAERQGVTLLASWHSRFAPAVDPARAWLAARKISRVAITWKEDVRVWHPRQSWIWQAGGLGVFDPGINALSILTRIIPGAWVVKSAELSFPRNCETPIAARLELIGPSAAMSYVDLDFLQTGTQTWDIDVDTDAGRLALSLGASLMSIDGRPLDMPQSAEYPNLYAHFAALVRQGASDVDVSPLRLVADAFLCARRLTVAPFIE